MSLKSLISIGFLLFFAGCATKQDKIKELDIDSTPKMQTPKIVEPVKRKKGTLYSRRGASLFADKKDLQVGDIIQVLIIETLQNTSKDERKTNKTNSTGINGGLSIGTNTQSPGDLNKAVGIANGLLGLSVKGGSTNTFTGKSESKNDEEFSTNISAIIEQTYQNGNYFIKGSKMMLINGQKQTIKISGVIRPYDITPDNTIKSSQIANLKVLYDKRGSEVDATDKPWGSEILERVSPF
jgi:flagellar L-ring protein precursor FlgH